MKRAALALCLLGAAGLPAVAESKLEHPDLSRYLRWGPLRVRPGFEMSDLGYDDNILYSTSRGNVGDYTATLSPKLDGLVLLGQRGFIDFKQRFDYTAYAENNSLNYLNNHTEARITAPLKRIGLFADGLWKRFFFRPIDQEDARTEGRERRYRAGLILTPGWRTEIEIRQTFRKLRYNDEDVVPGASQISERLDRTEFGTDIETRYQVHGRTHALFDALVRKVDFVSPFTNGDIVIERDTDEWRMLGGIELGRGGPLTGRARLGWASIDAVDPRIPDLSIPVGDAQIAYQFPTRTRLRLNYARLPGFAVYEASAYYINTNYGIRGVHYLNRLFGFEAGAARGRVEFPESLEGSEREDRIRRYDVGIRLRLSENVIGRKVEYSFKIGRYRRNSTDPGVVQSQTTVGFGAVLGF